MSRYRRNAVTAFLLCLFAALVSAHGPGGHGPKTADLTISTVDVLADGKVVATFVTGGEALGGLISFTLRPAANGAGYDGEWALAVEHADPTDPATGEQPEPHEHTNDAPHAEPQPHLDFLRLVHRGGVEGTVTGAQLTFDADGNLATFTAPMTLLRGFKEFDGATGTGDATLETLTLTF